MRNDDASSSMNILNSPRGWNHMLMVISSFATPLKLLINLKTTITNHGICNRDGDI